MKTLLRTTLASIVLWNVAGYAGDDLLMDSIPSLESASLGKAVIENNSRSSQNLFLEATGGWVFATGGDMTDGVDKYLEKDAFYGKSGNAHAALKGRSIDDIYGAGTSFSLKLGLSLDRITSSYSPKNPYTMTENRGRVYVRLSHTQFDGGAAELGYIDDCALTGDFHDFHDWGVALGYEKDFGTGRLHPFLGFEAGIKFVSDVKADLLTERGHYGHDYQDVSLYDDSVALGLLFSFGIDYDLTENLTIGIESGVGYQTGLDADDSDLAALDLEELNGAGGNFWSIPVLISARLMF